MGHKTIAGDHRKQHIRHMQEEQPDFAKSPQFSIPDRGNSEEWRQFLHGEGAEPDPEKLWKERHRGWNGEGERERPKPRFLSGFIRRTIISALVFGAVWGVFAVRQPWAYRAQDFITGALSKDMDFTAVRVWYDRYFDGAPAFIPMFGDGEETARKATAPHRLSPPIAGSIVSPFASTLKGVEIMPAEGEAGSAVVKSIDIGRVLSVSREAEGGIRVTVQHSGGITAEYGHLNGTKLKADDWVQGGDTVGWMEGKNGSSPKLLYFAVMRDKAYIDPAEEIGFD
ncbi:stage IV sporulation protein FA [Paenibacillus forsythiae]|uniref:Stage IV sporulation protein FA n=1 Tax=Paenibacillus forsythiae TaxID=365616 RepID=A0ABU3HE31_9BACL|nr:M23 family metallopeptidase [Paenibacillus forsythiae]MDT3429079.1 stage IV sporulation protein FA [Paenibacillus forsythiae]